MASLKYALTLKHVVRRTNSFFVPFTYKRTLSRNVCGAKCQSEIASDSKCKRPGIYPQKPWTNRMFSTKQEVSQDITETFSKQAAQHCGDDSVNIQTNDDDEVIEVPKDLTEAGFVEVMGDENIEKYAKTRLCRLTPEEEKLLKIIKLAYDVATSTGELTPKPEKMTDGRWLVLLICRRTQGPILRQLRYWAKLDFKIASAKLKKNPPSQYGEYDGQQHRHNKIFRRIESTAMNMHYFNNLAYAMQFGQPLLFDLSFERTMNVRTLTNTIEQIKSAHGINKLLWDPFHLHLCNYPTEGKFYHLTRKMCDIVRPDLPITVTNRDITELEDIPKEKLVYLTPDSPHNLNFNHHDVYVMGGLVDRAAIEPVTFAKAKRLNIRTAKLPLDRYMVFQGDKTLTLNQVMLILTDLKRGVPMKIALRHVPKRKVQRYLETEDDDFVFVENRYA